MIFLENLKRISKFCSDIGGGPLALWIFCHECCPSHKLSRYPLVYFHTQICLAPNKCLWGWSNRVCATWKLALVMGVQSQDNRMSLKRKIKKPGAREMAQGLRVLAALSEEQSLVPSTQFRWLRPLTPGDLTPLASSTHMYIPPCSYTHLYITKNLNLFKNRNSSLVGASSKCLYF